MDETTDGWSPTTVPTGGGTNKGRQPIRRRDIILFASGPVAFASAQLLGRAAPGFVDAVYGSALGPAVGWTLAHATGWLPFSLAEWVALGFILFQLCRLGRSLPESVFRGVEASRAHR